MRLGGLVCVLLVSAGCKDGQRSADVREGDAREHPDRAAPATREAFLDLLAPLPGPCVRIVYRVDGPGGLDGTLELLAKPGGFRRENWAFERPGPDGTVRVLRGSTIQTPDGLWSGEEGGTGVRSPSVLGGLADAYLALDPIRRLEAAQSLERWHADLERARLDHPGDVRTVANTPCLHMRIGAQDVCVWEQAGLPLEYRGAEFSLVAIRVEVDADASLTPDTFSLPAAGSDAAVGDGPPASALDPRRAIDALVAGDYGALATVLTPSVRLPVPIE
jgi:hypothetical protein